MLTSVLLAIFGSGFALALSVLAVYFRDMNYLWTIVIQVWFFATPIVYSPELLEERAPEWVQTLLSLNPMNGFVEVYRRCLYDAGAPGMEDAARPDRGVVRDAGRRLGDLPALRAEAPRRGVSELRHAASVPRSTLVRRDAR